MQLKFYNKYNNNIFNHFYSYTLNKIFDNKITIIKETNKNINFINNNFFNFGFLIPLNNIDYNINKKIENYLKYNSNLINFTYKTNSQLYINIDNDFLYFNINTLTKEEKLIELFNDLLKCLFKEKNLENNKNLNDINIKNKYIFNNNNYKLIKFLSDNKIILNDSLNENKKLKNNFSNILLIISGNFVNYNKFLTNFQNIFYPYVKKIKFDKNINSNKKLVINKDQLIKIKNNNSYTNIKVIYPSFPINHHFTLLYLLLNEIFGNSSSFNKGGPGKGLFTQNMKFIKKNNNIFDLSSLNFQFKNFGLFGLDCNCIFPKIEMINKIINFPNYFNLKNYEFNISKKILIRKILNQLENTKNRNEDIIKGYYYFNNIIDYNRIINKIKNINKFEIYKEIDKLKKLNKLIIIKGNIDKIKNLKI